MKKSIKDFQERALKNLSTVRGGGDDATGVIDAPIDRDKIKVPENGKKR